jgi:cytochrome c oxidase cbb3-type subunit IV
MDLSLMRAVVTVLLFVAFLGIVWWAYAKRNRAGFEEAARLPFLDEDRDAQTKDRHE